MTVTIIKKNYICKMYNYIRKCLLNSLKNHEKFFTQVIYNRTTVCSNAHSTNISWFWSHTKCKRFYCQVAVQDINIPTNPNAKDVEEQQQLDKFISNPNNKKFFQVLELEIDVLRHNAEKVPTRIRPKDWLELLNMPTKLQRKKYLTYLFINEKSNERKKAIKQQKKAEFEAKKLAKKEQTEDTDEIKYSLAHNALFLRIYDQSINHYYNSKLIWDTMFEPKIVIDCGYEHYMTNRENHNCAKQLTMAFSNNRIHNNPMFLHFCNLKEGGLLEQYFKRNMPNLLDKDFPAFVTSQSYLDLFPKDQLVYLTPHCKTDLVEYDANMIYIIGAMVDKTNPQPLSLAKGKREGLRMAKLPIEKYLDWGSGSTKNFTINQVLSIILDLKCTKSWEQALKHVPTRKLKPAREYMLQKKIAYTSKFLKRMDEKNNEKSDEIQTLTKSSTAINSKFDIRKKK